MRFSLSQSVPTTRLAGAPKLVTVHGPGQTCTPHKEPTFVPRHYRDGGSLVIKSAAVIESNQRVYLTDVFKPIVPVWKASNARSSAL